MKVLNLALMVFFITSAAAHAEALSFEDTEEFLQLQDETLVDVLASETWAYKFELIRPNKSTRVLTEKNKDVLLKPASTMKIFTGFWAYKLKNRSNTYISQMLRQSVNSMADATVQRMGGVYAMEDYYNDQGLELDSSNFVAADGSGLSYDNRTNCEVQIRLLKHIRQDANYHTFKKLMAQPGKNGTLQGRLKNYAGILFAKTGTLAKTAALSGFIETRKGTVAFCVMADYLKGSVSNARTKIDAMVKKNYNLALK